MTIAGKIYYERGKPVQILYPKPETDWLRGKGPRNVLIRRENGDIVVRPFRGLRKIK